MRCSFDGGTYSQQTIRQLMKSMYTSAIQECVEGKPLYYSSSLMVGKMRTKQTRARITSFRRLAFDRNHHSSILNGNIKVGHMQCTTSAHVIEA